MALKIKFDKDQNPIEPTFVIAHRNGDKIGVIKDKSNLSISASTNQIEFSFKISKYSNGVENPFWNDVKDLRLIWCKEYDTWFEITVEIEDSDETIKTVTGISLCESELSQTVLYGIEINTEDDILRDDYTIPTTIYNEDVPKASLLHRLLEKLPHYSIAHIDTSLMDLQYTFTFDNKTVKECLNEIAEEIKCVVVYGNGTKLEKGKYIPERSISLYDAQYYCQSCGYRDESFDVCPKCGSSLVKSSYGDDTTIFIDKDNLTDDITLTTNIDGVKNCFNLEAGDDLMTATIMNCNPNGSQYIWNITEDMKDDMPDDLVAKINQYENDYQYYQNSYMCASLNTYNRAVYNNLINKYKPYNDNLLNVEGSVIGFQSLMLAIYGMIDFDLFLTSELLPTIEVSTITAETELAKINKLNNTSIAVANLSSASSSTINSTIISVFKSIINSIYDVEIVESEYTKTSNVWRGNIRITNYSDEEDTIDSHTLTISINGNYEQFLRQKINSIQNKGNDSIATMSNILSISDITAFKAELSKYSLNALNTIHNCCQSCMDILVEQGIADKETWARNQTNLYESLYVGYYNKLLAIENEIELREYEISIIKDYENAAETDRAIIQKALNFSDYLGEELWKVFCSYRRDETYHNSNYISDGLDNAELFDTANKFLDVARKEIAKASVPETTIKATLNNLLVIPEFNKLLNYFELYNWLRIKIDGAIYKLRLISYTIDFENISKLDVEFSNVQYINGVVSDLSDILSRASSMSTSFDYVERQAGKGRSSYQQYERWRQDGLDATLTKIVNSAENQDILLDNHGLLARRYDDILDSYMPTQLKLINSTIAITNDNWETIKTAIGNFVYRNPESGEFESAYGINGEVIIGNLLLGEQLGIYSPDARMRFDNNGLRIDNGVNYITINPNADNFFVISKIVSDVQEVKLLYVDNQGMLHITGDGTGLDITANNSITGLQTSLQVTAGEIEGKIKSSSKVYDTGSYVITIWDFGEPDNETYPAASYNNRYYLDQNTGRLYLSNGSAWSLVITLTLIHNDTSSAIKQTADSVTSTVQQYAVNQDNIVRSDMESQITQTANQIKSIVSSAMNKYDETQFNHTINARGYGSPDDFTLYADGEYYYLDQLNGNVYFVDVFTTNGEKDWIVDYPPEATLPLITDNLHSEIVQTADEIKSTVAATITEWSETTDKNGNAVTYTIDYYGYGTPTDNNMAASSYNGKYYLNQTTGFTYLSNGSTWTKTSELMKLTNHLQSQITQNATDISLRVIKGDRTVSGSTVNDVISEINASTKGITLSTTGRLVITSGNFQLDSSGNATMNNATLTGGTIQSSNYAANTSGTQINLSTGEIDTKGFKVSSTGVVTMTSAALTGGTIQSSNYQIGAVGSTYPYGVVTGMQIDLANSTIKAKNFNLKSDGSLSVSNVEITSGVITSSNFASTTTNGVETASAGMKIRLSNGTILTKNFSLASDGTITAKSANLTDANVTGTIKTGTDTTWATEMKNGVINFTANGILVAQMHSFCVINNSGRFLGILGVDNTTNDYGGVIIGRYDTATTYTTYYRCNTNSNWYTNDDARHIFAGVVRFDDGVKFSGALTSLNFTSNYGLSWNNTLGIRYRNDVTNDGLYVGMDNYTIYLTGYNIKTTSKFYAVYGMEANAGLEINGGTFKVDTSNEAVIENNFRVKGTLNAVGGLNVNGGDINLNNSYKLCTHEIEMESNGIITNSNGTTLLKSYSDSVELGGSSISVSMKGNVNIDSNRTLNVTTINLQNGAEIQAQGGGRLIKGYTDAVYIGDDSHNTRIIGNGGGYVDFWYTSDGKKAVDFHCDYVALNGVIFAQ